jgi:uncharacterized protein
LTASLLALSLAVVATGYTVLGVTGFGSALLIVPVLAHWLPLDQVVPAILMLDVFACVLLGALSFRQVAWRELLVMAPGILIGTASGLLLPALLAPRLLLGALGTLVLLYALRGLLGAGLVRLANRRLALPAGFATGLIETLFGVAGPVLVMYLGGRLGNPAILRPTLAIGVVCASSAALVAFGFDGRLPSGTTLWLLGLSVLIIPLALRLGMRIARGLKPPAVVRLIHLLLLASGGSLLLRATAG